MPVIEPAAGNLEHPEHQGKLELGLVVLNELVSHLDSDSAGEFRGLTTYAEPCPSNQHPSVKFPS